MEERLIIVCFVLTLILVSTVSAEIMISQPKSTYNRGEELTLSITVSEGGKQLQSEIVCSNQSEMIFLKNLGAGEKSIQISQPLTKSFLGEMQGICNVKVTYGNEVSTSQEFKISGNIEISLNIANLNYKPGDSIIVEGTATKENSEPVDGFVEVTLEGTGIKRVMDVTGGKFSLTFNLPEDVGGGRYNLKARVYEKDSRGEIMNEGKETAIIGIKQEPKKLEIAINQQSIMPGEKLKFKIILYDQANYEMSGDASVVVKNTNDKEILKRLVKTDEEVSILIEENSPSGYWKIEASSSGITTKRLFSVEENEIAEFEVINDTLIINNIGNVLYQKAVQIAIGSEVEIKELFLEVGESKKFKLLAASGDYKVTVTDGTTTYSESDVSLTGSVVSIQDIKKQLSIWKKYPIVWLFLIIVSGLFILMLVQRTMKKSSYSYPVQEKKEKIPKETGEKKSFFGFGKRKETETERKEPKAEHSLVLGGKKQNTALICLKLKNKITKEARENLEKAFYEAYDIKAVSYETGDYIFLIFSPLLTKTFKNYVPAVKAAQGISKAINQHNSKFKDKIEFGICVHAGDLANKFDKEDKNLKFTAMGNTLGRAKKIADMSDGEVLLSKEIHEKTLSEIKAEQSKKFGKEIFTVKRVTDSQRNKEFVKDFLKKLNEEKPKDESKES